MYNSSVNDEQRLRFKLQQLKKLFDFKALLETDTDIKSISKYYKTNRFFYTFLSNRDNFIHMAISRNGKLRKEDFLVQVKIVEKYINTNTKNILELATGRGANLIYLAKKYPNINLVGIDLPNGQLDFAIKNGGGLRNFKPEVGDFHDLSKYSDNFFDIVFIIEALCHSSQKEKVIKEAKRVLKDKGIFIVIDGFADKSNLNKDELLAKKLVEKSMTVASFDNYNSFIKMLINNNLRIVLEEDYSLQIMPSLRRFEKDAKILLFLPTFIAKLLLKLFPQDFTKNAIAGYLMPELIKLRLAKYGVVASKLG